MHKKVNEFCMREYGEEANFEDEFAIPIAYADSVIGDHDVQVFYDIVNNLLYRDFAGFVLDKVWGIKEEDWDNFTQEFLTLGDWRHLTER